MELLFFYFRLLWVWLSLGLALSGSGSVKASEVEACQNELYSLAPEEEPAISKIGSDTSKQSHFKQMSPSQVMGLFEFPESANLTTSDPALRSAIFKAFSGKCFYSGQLITMDEMHIDHIIPVSLGGPNNFFNYVPTIARHNIRKNNRFDSVAAIPALTLLRTVYSPAVESELKKMRLSQSKVTIPKPSRPTNVPSRRRGFGVDQAIQKFLMADENRSHRSAVHWIPVLGENREINPILKSFMGLVRDGVLKAVSEPSSGDSFAQIKISQNQIQELFGTTSAEFSEALLAHSGIVEVGEVRSENRDRFSFQFGGAVLGISSTSHAIVIRLSGFFLRIMELSDEVRQRALKGEVIPWPQDM